MKSLPSTFALAAITVLTLSGCSEGSTPIQPELDAALVPSVVGGVDVIVVLNQDFAPGGHAANQAAAAEIARGLGIAPALTYGTALFGFSATVPEGRLGALSRDPRVAYWEQDQIASIPFPRAQAPGFCDTNPTHSACGGGSTGQVTPWGVTRVGGASAPTGSAWVIDTGIDSKHKDLNVDGSRGASFVTRGKYSWEDGHGHGTHVAGTIAAIDNTQDVVGVAAGAPVIAVRVLDSNGSGAYSWVIAGVDHVAANASPDDVANMSLGGPESQALEDAVIAAATAGVRFALAAGNESTDASTRSPAGADHANIWTVSAIGEDDCLAYFSNFGSPVDVAGPGVAVLSTAKGGGTVSYS
ncbi:MAG: S8 family serine peptidase, partial [Gemmatimonadota bacterium]|nr:S8 family serine peptidase [Gemmatimonadota bacterium]